MSRLKARVDRLERVAESAGSGFWTQVAARFWPGEELGDVAAFTRIWTAISNGDGPALASGTQHT